MSPGKPFILEEGKTLKVKNQSHGAQKTAPSGGFLPAFLSSLCNECSTVDDDDDDDDDADAGDSSSA